MEESRYNLSIIWKWVSKTCSLYRERSATTRVLYTRYNPSVIYIENAPVQPVRYKEGGRYNPCMQMASQTPPPRETQIEGSVWVDNSQGSGAPILFSLFYLFTFVSYERCDIVRSYIAATGCRKDPLIVTCGQPLIVTCGQT